MKPEIERDQNLCVETKTTATTDLVSLLRDCHFLRPLHKMQNTDQRPTGCVLWCFSARGKALQQNDETLNGAINLNCTSCPHYATVLL